ncbi:hypothetical protein PLICRDRAFT_312513 [Plicaturopsis crispa FD-325 SS-3]|nr:hypothetical protein PLICRDRAFT_312513 [Plicaturopsis crispa FD-325 SS-3]
MPFASISNKKTIHSLQGTPRAYIRDVRCYRLLSERPTAATATEDTSRPRCAQAFNGAGPLPHAQKRSSCALALKIHSPKNQVASRKQSDKHSDPGRYKQSDTCGIPIDLPSAYQGADAGLRSHHVSAGRSQRMPPADDTRGQTPSRAMLSSSARSARPPTVYARISILGYPYCVQDRTGHDAAGKCAHRIVKLAHLVVLAYRAMKQHRRNRVSPARVSDHQENPANRTRVQ